MPTYPQEALAEEDARNHNGTWLDEMPNGNDRNNAARYAVMDDILRG